MPSPPLEITHGKMTSGVACHHRPSTTHTVGRRRAWHDLTALGQRTQSDYVGRGMTSPPLDSHTVERRRAFHYRLWAAHTVERRLAWHAIIAFGLADTVGRHQVWHAIIALGRKKTVERRRA